MVRKHQGYHNRTRHVYRKNVRARGLPGLSQFLIDYEVGMKIDIVGNPTFQKRGFPHRRFHGKTGTIIAPRGRCFEVEVKIGNKMKKIYIGQEHFKINKDWETRNAAVVANK